MMKNNSINTLIAVCLVAFTVVARLVFFKMHLNNFAPIAAVGVFAGAVIRDRRLLAFLVPLAGQFIADLYLEFFTTTPGFYPGEWMNYLAMAMAAGVGMFIKEVKPVQAVFGLISGSFLFFLVSNFSCFIIGMYGYTLNGLITTYKMGWPFFRDHSFPADLIGGVILFGGYFLTQKALVKKMQKAEA